MIVFVYWLGGEPLGDRELETHVHQNRRYAFLMVPAASYEAQSRLRSPSWGTVAMPAKAFRELAAPIPA
jgi:hypothetical protein